ncbi:MAG TPA: hypothetical protein VF488_10710 [Gemmatimonadaceae bacterium]
MFVEDGRDEVDLATTAAAGRVIGPHSFVASVSQGDADARTSCHPLPVSVVVATAALGVSARAVMNHDTTRTAAP